MSPHAALPGGPAEFAVDLASVALRAPEDIRKEFGEMGTRTTLDRLLSRVLDAVRGLPGTAEHAGAGEGVLPELPDIEPRLSAAIEQEDTAGIRRECLALAEWAEAQQATGTAHAFMQLALRLAPDEPRLNYRMGKLARRRADHEQARTYYGRAVRLGEAAGDWETVGLAYSGLGNLEHQLGNDGAAAEMHKESLRTGRAYGLRGVEMDALHNLSVISFAQRDGDNGVFYASKALDAYARRPERLAILANDLAWYWMTEEGAYARALPVFEQLYRYFQTPREQLFAAANLGRAAGGAGHRDAFGRAWQAVWSRVDEGGEREGHASALAELAHGALALRRWNDARAAASRAVEIAEARGEVAVLGDAREVLEAVARSEVVPERRAAVRLSPDVMRKADELGARLVQALRIFVGELAAG